MKTKQEAIQEAWKDYWVYIPHQAKSQVIEFDGWIFVTYMPASFDDDLFDFKHDRMICRPKSLRGIEDNNGWIRIESEEDLPKEPVWCWVVKKGKDYQYERPMKFDPFGKLFNYHNICVSYERISHIHPIVKPKPPIY